jgi:hypothetical protein
MTDVIQEAKEKSVELLRALSTECGFLASSEDRANYKRVFSRDAVIAGLASLTVEDEGLHDTFRRSLYTLRDHQDYTGRIPSNVDCVHGHVSYGTIVGRVDATIWYIIGVTQYVLRTGDRGFYEQHTEAIGKALYYLECLEFNGRGLIYVPQGGDWADTYINHGYVLFDQLLHLIALRGHAAVTGDERAASRAEHIKQLIQVNFFPTVQNKEHELVYNKALFTESLNEYRPPLPLAYFSSYGVGYHVDNFANSLLLQLDIVNDDVKEAIAHTVLAQCRQEAFPIIAAFHPVITKDSSEWERLEHHYLYEFRNKPFHYHNGGLWPMVHGFFLSYFFTEDMTDELTRFAEVLKRDMFMFPEYFDGEQYQAQGTQNLSFSASGYLLATAAHEKKEPLFRFNFV